LNPNSYNTLNYQEKFIQLVDSEQSKLLEDKNFKMLLEILNEGPKSVLEIVDSFKQNKNEKHLKTIYRYLRTLQKSQLIVPAGLINTDLDKRVNASRTLYGRSAKIFYTYQIYDDLIENADETRAWFEKAAKMLEFLLESQTELGKMDKVRFSKVLGEIFQHQHKTLLALAKIPNANVAHLFEDIDSVETNQILDIYINLSLFLNGKDWIKKILDCFDS